eukprot:7346294-Prymnesium_polylepis.1
MSAGRACHKLRRRWWCTHLRLLQQLLGMRHYGGLLIRTVAQILLARVLCSGVWGGGPARRSRLAIEDGRRQ